MKQLMKLVEFLCCVINVCCVYIFLSMPSTALLLLKRALSLVQVILT